MHEVGVGLVEGIRHLRDLSQRGGIEMADAALVERAQHQRMRIALHRIEHSAGKLADEAPGSAREHVGAQAVDGVDRLPSKTGRASCRKRVCQYVQISVVAVSLKKKRTRQI